MDVGWAIRSAAPEELPGLVTTDWAAFGNRPTSTQVDNARDSVEADRMVVAVEGERIVGTAAALSLEMTVPRPMAVPAAGVTYVGVLPTHRRQGILTALMGRVLDGAAERGEPFSALLASESTIYRRFGYGAAVVCHSVEIERHHAALRRPVDVRGRLELVDSDAMADVLPPVYDRYRRQQPGELGRGPSYWRSLLRPPEGSGEGSRPRFAALYKGGRGYVTYRLKPGWDDGLPGYTLAIDEVVAVDPEIRAALWQYCLDVDLVRLVSAWNVPPDEPLGWMLADPRRLKVTGVKDFLWLRLLDVEAALGARSYGEGRSLVIDVADPFRKNVAGRYRLDGQGATCRRTDELPDLALDIADLGAAYLGGVRFETLRRAGLVAELAPGSVARADALFATATAPACYTGF